MKHLTLLFAMLLMLPCCSHKKSTQNADMQTDTIVDVTDTIVAIDTIDITDTVAAVIAIADEIVRLDSLDMLPEGCNQETAFGLVFDFAGYVFEGMLYPLHDKRWIVLSYWCLDEEETIYMEDENGSEVPAATRYKDPFKGIRYPVIKTDSVSFSTRNYGGQELHLYTTADGDSIAYTINFECSLDVTDADVTTRRVLCQTNPNDWMWGVPENEDEKEWKREYVYVKGWVDEEWICANLLTTCP